MRRFQTIIENVMRNSQLTRVKLRVDPANCVSGEITQYNGYEGYILAEDEDNVSVYLECGGECVGDIVTVPSSMIDVVQSLTPLERFKILTLKQLLVNRKIDKNSATVQMLAVANSPEAVEAILIELGATESDLLKIYKQLVFDDVI